MHAFSPPTEPAADAPRPRVTKEQLQPPLPEECVPHSYSGMRNALRARKLHGAACDAVAWAISRRKKEAPEQPGGRRFGPLDDGVSSGQYGYGKAVDTYGNVAKRVRTELAS